MKQNEAAPPSRREEKEQHPRGATRTTPTREEGKAAPHKRRLSLLFFSFCFQSLVGVAPLKAPKSNFDNRKESNFKQVVGLCFHKLSGV